MLGRPQSWKKQELVSRAGLDGSGRLWETQASLAVLDQEPLPSGVRSKSRGPHPRAH